MSSQAATRADAAHFDDFDVMTYDIDGTTYDDAYNASLDDSQLDYPSTFPTQASGDMGRLSRTTHTSRAASGASLIRCPVDSCGKSFEQPYKAK
jgi:hypothetical protein